MTTLRDLDRYQKIRAIAQDTSAGGEAEREVARRQCREMETEHPGIEIALRACLRALENPYASFGASPGAAGPRAPRPSPAGAGPAAVVSPLIQDILTRIATKGAEVGEQKVEQALNEVFGTATPPGWDPLDPGKAQVRPRAGAPDGAVWIEIRAWRRNLTARTIDKILDMTDALLLRSSA